MKAFFISVLLLIWSFSVAQIQITQQDMPLPGDTFRISTSSNLSGINYQYGGSNKVWDFTSLTASGQEMRDYRSIASTPIIFNIVFAYPLVATVAAKRPDMQLATVSFTDGYNFYKTSSSQFAEVGFGANIQGAPIPVKYQSDDVIYHLPLSFGDLDSSDAAWNVSIPSLGSVYETRHRVTKVDGYGQVKIPLGTFTCLRLKSTVYQRDSIIYSGSPFPLPVIPTSYVEYIWLAAGMPAPVVKVTERAMVKEVEYMDSIQSFVGIKEKLNESNWTFYPNPVRNQLSIQGLNQGDKVEILDVQGQVVETLHGNGNFSIKHLERGLYFLRKENSNKIQKLIIL